MEKYKHEKELVGRRNLKDSADDFIQNPQDRIVLSGSESISVQSEYLKKKFLKRKKKLSSYLPKEKENSKDKFTKLGSFKTEVGEVSVGYEKFKPNSDFRFTLLSDEEKDFDIRNSKMSFDDDRNYFRRPCDNKNEKKYKENNTTLEWNPRDDDLRRVHEIFTDDIVEDEDEILYDDEIENVEISNLKRHSDLLSPVAKENALSDLRDIKVQKKKDNQLFESSIKKFSKMYKKNKLKKIEDPDQLKVALERISSDGLYFILQKKMKEKLQKKLCIVVDLILRKMKGRS